MRGSPELSKEIAGVVAKNEEFGHYLDSYFLLAGEDRERK